VKRILKKNEENKSNAIYTTCAASREKIEAMMLKMKE